MKLTWRGGRSKEEIYLDGGRRTTQLMRDSLGSAGYHMRSLTRNPQTKLLAFANLILATACVVGIVVLFGHYHSVVNSGQRYDIEILNGPYFAAIVLLPCGALLSLAAAAHWWRWPLRWLFQGLTLALLLGVLLLFVLRPEWGAA